MSSSQRAKWTPDQERLLVGTLIQQQRVGRRVKNGFKKEAWTVAATQLRTECGRTYSAAQLKNKFSVMKTRFLVFEKLRGTSGFGWCEIKKIPEADDATWDDYLSKESNKSAAEFRHRGLDNYEALSCLFSEWSATGDSCYVLSADNMLVTPCAGGRRTAEEAFESDEESTAEPKEESVSEWQSIVVLANSIEKTFGYKATIASAPARAVEALIEDYGHLSSALLAKAIDLMLEPHVPSVFLALPQSAVRDAWLERRLGQPVGLPASLEASWCRISKGSDA